MSPLMTVGEFALATGLSTKALRFYGVRSVPASGAQWARCGPAARARCIRRSGSAVAETVVQV